MGRSQRQEEPPGRGDSRTKDLLGDKLVSLRGRNKVEVGWSPQVKRGAWARGVQGEVTVATAAGQPGNGGRLQHLCSKPFPSRDEGSLLPPRAGTVAGAQGPGQVGIGPMPQSQSRFHHPNVGTGSQSWLSLLVAEDPQLTSQALVIPTLALGLELGRRAAGMHNAQDSCLPYIPDATRQPCH